MSSSPAPAISSAITADMATHVPPAPVEARDPSRSYDPLPLGDAPVTVSTACALTPDGDAVATTL